MVAGHLREQNGIYQIILSWKDVNGKRKGRFELEFYGPEDLQVLLDALMKIKE